MCRWILRDGGQIRRKPFSWYVGEKHVGLDKKRKFSQKEHVLSLQHLSQHSTRSIFCRLDPVAVAVQLSANFHLLVHCCIFIFGSLLSLLRTGPRTFPWSRLFIPKRITPRKHDACMVADQLSSQQEIIKVREWIPHIGPLTKPLFSRVMFTLVLFLLYWSEVFSRINTVTNLGKWRQNQK